MAMQTSREVAQELIGEHKAILAYMGSLVKSGKNLASQPAKDKERIWNYCCRLYDFKDAIWSHLEIDERLYKSLSGDVYFDNPVREHQEIQRLVNEMITQVENTAIDKLDPAALDRHCESIGNAFDKTCKLIELHIAKENAILERVQTALNHQSV
jgi:hypothetical protein